MVEAKLQEREEALQLQMEEKEKKLAAASKALHRTRGQVQQLNAQLGLKDIEGSKLQCQVVQLRNLLVEKEKRLQDALDEMAEAGSSVLPAAQPLRGAQPTLPEHRGARAEGTAGDEAEEVASERAQQPQEPPTAYAAAAPDEEQFLQLSRITEELTEALEAARESEAETQRQLGEAAERLTAVRRERDLEVATLERALAAERSRAKEMEERASRAVLEDRLQQALALKGKSQWHPHLEV